MAGEAASIGNRGLAGLRLRRSFRWWRWLRRRRIIRWWWWRGRTRGGRRPRGWTPIIWSFRTRWIDAWDWSSSLSRTTVHDWTSGVTGCRTCRINRRMVVKSNYRINYTLAMYTNKWGFDEDKLRDEKFTILRCKSEFKIMTLVLVSHPPPLKNFG